MFRRICIAALCACALAACSPAPPPNTVLTREQQAVSALKTRYKGVVMGTDVQGTTLDVYVDVDRLYSMDEPAEDAMKADALRRWKAVWTHEHPRRHAVLHLRLRDYYGKDVYTSSVRV